MRTQALEQVLAAELLQVDVRHDRAYLRRQLLVAGRRLRVAGVLDNGRPLLLGPLL